MNTTGSDTVSIPVVQIDGAVNPVTDRIAGKVYDVSYPAKVVAEVWTENGTRVEGLTNGTGNYDLNLAPFDVRNGHMVALWYVRPDGHQVGIVRQALFVRVYPADDTLWGMTAPNTEVSHHPARRGRPSEGQCDRDQWVGRRLEHRDPQRRDARGNRRPRQGARGGRRPHRRHHRAAHHRAA